LMQFGVIGPADALNKYLTCMMESLELP
jgi:hypothetical protein